MRTALPLTLLLGLALAAPMYAQAPATLSYQGYLEDAGTPVDDPRAELTFRLIDGSDNVVWSETHPSEAVDGGFIDVVLGSVNPLTGYDFAETLVLEVDYGGTTLAPRTPLTATPYALGLHLPLVTQAAVGGTAFSVNNMTGGASGDAIKAETHATAGRALVGQASAFTGENAGVYGLSQSPDGVGVHGKNTNGGAGYGLYGEGGRYGLYADGGQYGVYAEADGNSLPVYGVYAKVTKVGAGVFGEGVEVGVQGQGGQYGVTGSGDDAGVRGSGGSVGVLGSATAVGAHGGSFVGSTGLYASGDGADNSDGADVVLGGSNGRIYSEAGRDDADIFFHSNDGFAIYLDDDGTGTDADFLVYDKDGNVLFDVDESGTVLVNGTIVHSSDRARKERIEPLDGAAVLQQVRELPLYRWSYRGEATRHVGPMAQDFAAAFGLGADDRHIATVDADGVALAAVQALARQVEQQQAEIDALRAEVEALRRRRAGE